MSTRTHRNSKRASRAPKKPSTNKPDGKSLRVKRSMPKAPSRRSLQRDESTLSYDSNAYVQPVEVTKVPDNQITDLTPEQLNEVFTKVLSATDPHHTSGVVNFNYKKGEFAAASMDDQLAIHFEMDSSLILRDSHEAKVQEERAHTTEKARKRAERAVLMRVASTASLAEAAVGPEEDEEEDGETKALKNQFNFSERAAQTVNFPYRNRQVETEPPPCRTFAANVTQWAIYDAYMQRVKESLEAKAQKELAKQRHGKDVQTDELDVIPPPEPASDRKILESEKCLSTAKIMERMVNQNAEDDTFHDFKYYEHDADSIREDGRGDFLALWRFSSALSKRKAVTALKWNPKFTDLFAISFGSYDFLKQGQGLICCYSLKNTSHPEYTFTTPSGVLSLDWHPDHPHLLAAGLYDGSVCVFDVLKKDNKPIYSSVDPRSKHTDPVWQVSWLQDKHSKDIGFYSISSDGRVTNWIMRKNELMNEEVMEIKLPQRADGADDDEPLSGFAGGSCFDFNPEYPNLFLVGTEEGSVHCYSKAFTSQYIKSYESHQMVVYAVKWNPFNPNIFLTCSDDWTVKLW